MRTWLLVVTSGLTLALCSDLCARPLLHRGGSLGFFREDQDSMLALAHYKEKLFELHAAGATDVQLSVRWFQDDISDHHIRPIPGRTVGDHTLRGVIEVAHGLGLRVFLMPFVYVLDESPGSWRGAIQPADEDLWWRSYGNYIEHYARLAATTKVSLFSVGSELKTRATHAHRWGELIGRVKATFPGRITYSANWDNYQRFSTWDLMDVVAINAYFPLTQSYRPSVPALVDAWMPHKAALVDWSASHARPYIFSEAGYRSSMIAPSEPWVHFDMPTPDLTTQWRCYKALKLAWVDAPAFNGLYIWNWFDPGGPEDAGFTPSGKPALEVLRRWFDAP